MKTKIISILALLLTVTQGAWAETCKGEIRALDWQNGSIYVAGWAYDPDATSTSINVDYYIYTTSGNPGSSSVKSGRLLANGSNSHSWYTISGNHEFSGHIDLTGVAAGNYYICSWSRPIYDFMVMNGFTPADKATEEAIHRDEPFIVKCHMK